MTDLDKSGYGFQRVRTYLGPSLGWVDEIVQPATSITVGGTHTVQPGESLLLVDVAATVTIQLPDVVKWMQQTGGQPATGFDRSITVKDIGGNANNFNIIVAPFGQQTIDNIQQSTVISIAREIIRFVPLNDMTGWVVQANQGGGGGSGGGGDVFKAGNNTFTGTNTFQGITTVPTMPSPDNSLNAASTAFVQNQGYLTSVSLSPYALINSPLFVGDPKAPTPSPGDNDTSIATTAFVQAALSGFTGGAPVGAEYITSSANATLTAERVLTNTASITWDFSTPGQAKASTAAGGGNVSTSGSPVNGQLAQWVTATTITGIDGSTLYAPIASPTFTGDPKAPTPITSDNDTSIATTAFVKTNLSNYQPLDADLTSLAGLGGTNTIYYRSAPDIWSPVTFSGLTFSGGVLTAAGGGNVNNSGSPASGQYARWTTPTIIQGVSPATVLGDIGAQPLDGDLTSLAAASNIGAMYYRSAADTWGPVTIGTGLTFGGGTLTAAAAGTTISDTPPGSPTPGALWWESDTGTLWIYYNDGNTSQWVAAGGIAASNGGLLNMRVFTTSQTFTPTPGMMSAIVEAVGGGGAGGGMTGGAGICTSSAGGGAGGYSKVRLTALQVGASQPITIGAGGTGVTSAAGNNGGVTSFGSLCIANGGKGGGPYPVVGTGPSSGAGGVTAGAVGDLVAGGAPGGPTQIGTSAAFTYGTGFGGSSHFGGGAVAPSDVSGGTTPGLAATNYGSGGSGCMSYNSGTGAGGNGSAGVVIVTEYS